MDFAGAPPTEAMLREMVCSIGHRGPDDSGIAVMGPAAIAQARLSIIDLSPTGHQPMFSPDGSVAIVYNGETYNYPELRTRLESLGVRFRGTSDTEVVLHAYLHWGVDCLAMLNGMFAIAIWDERTRQLWLARDRFGIKPLYYHRTASGIAFGSEVKAILATGRVARAIDPSALHEYLYYGNALGTNSLFAGVRKLLPAHYLGFNECGEEVRPYWSLAAVKQHAPPEAEARDRIRELLDSAMRSHLLSDVPVGVFLSGGIDSSAIVALASRHYAGRLKTYSVGFDFDRGVNELPKARLVAEQFGTEHHELHIAGRNMPEVIERLVRCHDEPFADAADIPLYLLCEQLAGQVKVILQGDGGDEIFAGYRRYNFLSFAWFWQPVARLCMPFDSLRPKGPTGDRAARFFQLMLESDPARQMAWLLTTETPQEPPTRVLGADLRREVEAHDPFARHREVYAAVRHLDPIQQILYFDTLVTLPDDFFEKVDKSTMAHSIEVRVPFLDKDLTDYVLGLPSSMKIRGGQKKRILRAALRGIVPDEILDGRKTGFGVPFQWWLKEPLHDYVKSVLLDRNVLGSGMIDGPRVERLLAEHASGRRDHGFILYKLLLLALWWRFYIADAAAPAPFRTSTVAAAAR